MVAHAAVPEGWTEEDLGDLATVYSGGTPSRAVNEHWGGPVPWVTTAEIDFGRICTTRQAITHQGLLNSAARIAPPRTVLLAMYGQGKTRGKSAILGISAAMNQACAAIEARERLVPEYLFHYLGAHYGEIRAMSNSGNQENLSGEIVRRIRILVPELAEQVRITAALDDISSLISSIERLIAKKRDLKQGLMQELLTGRTRLPGFSGQWQTRSIGDFAQVKAGGTPSTSVPRYWGGQIRWMSSGEIHKKRVAEVDGRITEDGLRESAAQLLPVGTVLMALAGQGKTRGTVAVSEVKLATNQSIAGILPTVTHDPEFLYYNLDTRYKELRGESAGDGGRGGLNLTIIKKLHVRMPEFEEQQAISGVLRDADAEITALSRRLESARNIKEGMMQELLTGRTRLVSEIAA